MVFYNDIELEIRPFLGIDEVMFNSLPEGTRNALKQGARVEWLSKGAPKIDSLRYPAEEGDHGDIDDIEELTEYYYEHYAKETTMGIDEHRFTLRSQITKPSISQFIDIMIHQSKLLNATNVVVSYIDNDDMIHHLAFSNKDLHQYSIDELLELLRKGSENWGDDGIYVGSDVVRDGYKTYRINNDHFRVIVKHTRGGYGKMIADYYDTLGLENNEDDCLIQCFLYIYEQDYPGRTKPNVKELRERLMKEGKLGIDAVPLLEEIFKIKVSICQDYHHVDIKYEGPQLSNMKRLPPYTEFKAKIVKDEEVYIYGNAQCPWKILYKDEHYDIVTKSYTAAQCLCPYTGEMLPRRKPFNKKILTQKIIEHYYVDTENLTQGAQSDDEEEKNVYYYFFDYETIFDTDTMEIIPYAYAIIKCDSQFNIIEERYKIGMDCNKHLSNYLFRERPNKSCDIKYLIGYNNSRFDNFILLKEAIKYDDYIGHVRFAGNTIVSANINDFKVRDLCRILNMPLDNACKAFKIELPKLTGAIQHHEVQFAYMGKRRDEFNEYLINHHDTIKQYVIRDCVCLSQLYNVTKDTISKSINLNIEDHYTLAGMSYKGFKSTTNTTTQLPILNNNNIIKDKFIRQAIIGGRSQMRFSENAKGNMCAIDCVSLYPYVMLNRRFPIGQPIDTDKYVKDKIGVYNVKVIRQPHERLNSIPSRDKMGKLDWNNKGEIECTLCSVDIECLKRYGGEVEIKEGIYWENDKNNLFDHYFKELIKEKKQQDEWKEQGDLMYNPVIRETDKLLMNALSGKLAQRLYTVVTEIVRNAKDIDRFYNKTIPGTQVLIPFGSKFIAQGKKEGIPNMPTIYGIMIYAYAREHMYDSILQHLKPEELYGMDTDSAFITEECLNKIPKYLMGNDFGQFKVELKDCNGIFVAPKCYCFYNEKEIVKARFKGVKVAKDVECDYDYKQENPIEIYKYYHSNKSNKVGLNTFKKLLVNKKCKIICCNINKSIISNNNNKKIGLYLSNHTFIKEIEVKDEEIVIINEDDIIVDA